MHQSVLRIVIGVAYHEGDVTLTMARAINDAGQEVIPTEEGQGTGPFDVGRLMWFVEQAILCHEEALPF